MTSATLSTKRGYPNVKRDSILSKRIRVSPERTTSVNEATGEKHIKAIVVTPEAKREPWEEEEKNETFVVPCVSLHPQEIEWPTMTTIVNDYLVRTNNVHELVDALWFLHHEFRTNYDHMLFVKQCEFLALHGQDRVFQVMLNNVDNYKIQEIGLFVLMNATYKNIELATAISKSSYGIKAIMVAMKMHPTRRDVHFFGLKTLEQLCCCVKSNSDMLVDKLDAVPFLVEVLTTTFSHNRDIVEVAADVLYQFCLVERLRKLLRCSFKVVGALATAIETVKGDAQSAALDTLNLLTMKFE